MLQRHAATLRQQDEPNIDDLLSIVNESVAAYKVCKERIDAVAKALDEALAGAGAEGGGKGGKPRWRMRRRRGVRLLGVRARPAAEAAGVDEDDGDVPF